MANPKLIAAIQACRRQVPGLEDDDTWRSWLKGVAGQDSLRAMDGRALGRVMDALHAAGAPRRPGAGAAAKSLADSPQARMARGLWIELADAGAVRDRSEKALASFCRRVTGVDRLEWLRAEQANKLVEALKDWRKRADQQADRRTVEELWDALIAAGAMKTGAHARLGTWLLKNYGVAGTEHLATADLAEARTRLLRWLARVEAPR